jgi:hypothetical protein
MLFYLDWVSADLGFRAPLKDVAYAIKRSAPTACAKSPRHASQVAARRANPDRDAERDRARRRRQPNNGQPDRARRPSWQQSGCLVKSKGGRVETTASPLRRQPPIAFGAARHQVDAFPIGKPPHSAKVHAFLTRDP